jgi:2-C-methyl-D-erythritol 4-phosphate cytidylyltransferase
MLDAATRGSDADSGRPIALIAAGGEGRRLGSIGPKALVECAGRPLIAWCLDAFAASRTYGSAAGLVIVAAHGSRIEQFEAAGEQARGQGLDLTVVAGGPSRSHSVAAALAAAEGHDEAEETVLVHDAARIFLTPALIDSLASALATAPDSVDGLVAARRVTDTIKLVDERGIVSETPPRERLWAVQTPQAFRRDALAAALGLGEAVPDHKLAEATDDASLIEASGGQIGVFEWTEPNGKITTLEDLAAAERRLRRSNA